MNLSDYCRALKQYNLLPRNLSFSSWDGWHIVAAHDYVKDKFISDSVTMGIDKDCDVAAFKALTEYAEKTLYQTVLHPVLQAHLRSDGLAAMPTFLESSKSRARENAFNEALERYVWASWWDNKDIKHTLFELDINDLHNIKSYFKLRSLRNIKIETDYNSKEMILLLAETSSGGFITGGALDDSFQKAFDRAFGELLRHLFVFQKMSDVDLDSMSFYEKRLYGFGSGRWRDIALARIRSVGFKRLEVPILEFDEEVPHYCSSLVTLHRCLFKNQPLFIGGEVERLCI